MQPPWVELERAAALGWRAPEEQALGEWLLRAAEGFTGRANSALALGDPGMPVGEAIETVVGFYRARGLPPMVSVPHPLDGPPPQSVDRELARRGWGLRAGSAVVMTTPATPVAAHDGPPVLLDPEPDEAWLALYHYRGQALPAVGRVLMLSAPQQVFASVRRGGAVLAIGRLAVAGGWGGLAAIEVDPRHRRRGLGGAITRSLVGQAARLGVGGVYLQVDEANEPARALYRATGWVDSHRYHYRVAPPA